jgi:hypothetical protein
MQAYEFVAKPEDGRITIPAEYRHLITSNVRVIVLPSADKTDLPHPCRKSDLILPPSINTEGWKFDREEANER